MTIKFGPNGIEYESSFTTTTIDVVDNVSGNIVINEKRFKLILDNSDGTTVDRSKDRVEVNSGSGVSSVWNIPCCV